MKFLPCLDNADRSTSMRRRLDIERGAAARLGAEAVQISRAGGYTAPDGRWVDLREPIASAMASRRSIPPQDALPPGEAPSGETVVQVTQETSMDAGQRLVADGRRVLILNFASGISPGGGFLHGARAQEECLARCSALFVTLEGDPMYAAHARRPEPDSTSWAILSPDVPFFREESGPLLDEPRTLSVLTCAAPVAHRVGVARSTELMAERIERVLDIGHAFGFDALVLGAWGCGAFRNDATTVAQLFANGLRKRDGRFREVAFAISDWSDERRFLGPFRDAFRGGVG